MNLIVVPGKFTLKGAGHEWSGGGTGWGASDGMSREPNFTGLPSLVSNWRD